MPVLRQWAGTPGFSLAGCEPPNGLEDDQMAIAPAVYTIRIRGRLGGTALSAFPTMVSEVAGGDTVLTGLLEDRSAVFGVIAQIEALGLELLELRDIRASPRPHDCRCPRGPDVGG
jgi:hypothetical protein